jgi:hypothetical protein
MEFLKHDKRRILMKKNTLLWITAVVFIAALVLGGCPSPTNGGGSKDPVLTGISVTPATRSLGVNQKTTLSASPIPATVELGEITWSSDDTAKVTVNATTGEITAVAITTTPVKVWATSVAKPKIKGSCNVTVTEFGTPPVSITVTPPTKELTINTTFTLTATQAPSEAADTIKWTSADTSKVTVNETTGEITAVAVTTTAVRVTATSVETPAVSGYCDVTVAAGPVELKMTFIGGGSAEAPEFPTKNSNNTYAFPNVGATGNYASASGFVDTMLIYPDKVLNGDFKLRARIQITDFGGSTSTSKGLVIGAFKGATGPGDFATGGGGTLTTAINVRMNGVVRNYQSRNGDNLAAVGLNLTFPDKNEEFIYEVIRDESGIKTSVYISKSGDLLPGFTGTVPYTNSNGEVFIQADTPVYAGIAVAAAGVNVSQVQLWDSLDDGAAAIYYSGNSTPAPVAVTGISVKEKNGKGSLTTNGSNPGTSGNPAQLLLRLAETTGGIELEADIRPAYADIPGAQFYISENLSHPNDENMTVNENTGVITNITVGQTTVEAISNDPIEAKYFLTITVTADYVPVTDFTITGGTSTLQKEQQTTLGTDISPTVTDPVVVWTISPATAAKFLDADNEQVDTVTGPGATIVALGVTVDTEVTVTATATTTDSSSVTTTKTATKKVEVKAPSQEGPQLPQIWNTTVGSGTGAVTLGSGNQTLTMTGTGNINSTSNNYNFVYLPATTGDFTMMVKVNSFAFTNTNSASRVGILAVSQTGIVQNTTTGALTPAETDGVNPSSSAAVYGAAGIRPESTNYSFSSFRTAAGGWSASAITGTTNYWLKLQRVSGVFTAGICSDTTITADSTWTTHSQTSANLNLPGAVYIGLFAGSNSTASTVVFGDLYFGVGEGKGAATVLPANLTKIDFSWLE